MSKLIIKKQYSPEPRDIYFTVPNFISLLRIISIPFIAMLVSHHRMVTALVVLALSAISDGLDGMIARSFNQVSKIGQILDPIADRLLIFCSILALGVANIIPWWMLIVVGLLVKRFPMLIAGYNTMPPAKKKNVDIGGLSSFMRRHLVIMGALWILFTVVLELTDQTDTLAVIYIIYLLPYVVWMLVRAQRYDHN